MQHRIICVVYAVTAKWQQYWILFMRKYLNFLTTCQRSCSTNLLVWDTSVFVIIGIIGCLHYIFLKKRAPFSAHFLGKDPQNIPYSQQTGNVISFLEAEKHKI